MTRAAIALPLVAVLVVAGCLGGGGGASSPASPTATPAAATQTYGSVDALPGVEGGRVTDPAALLAANARALAGEGYVAVLNRTDRYNTSRAATRVRTVSRVSAGGAWAVEREGWYLDDGRRYVRLAAWSNGSVGALRYWRHGDGVRYLPADVTHAPNESLSADILGGLLRDGAFVHATTRERDGTTLYVFVADGYGPEVDRRNDTFAGRLVVDEHGRIRLLRVTFVGVDPHDDERVRITFAYELRRVGAVDVARPDWLGAAREAGALQHCEDDTADFECT